MGSGYYTSLLTEMLIQMWSLRRSLYFTACLIQNTNSTAHVTPVIHAQLVYFYLDSMCMGRMLFYRAFDYGHRI
jgi:hypothetical protein